MAQPRKARPSYRRMPCAELPLHLKPAGFRFYHTHVAAKGDLNRGTYTGQAGPVYIEPKTNPGGYDREVFLVVKEFTRAFSRGGDMALDVLASAPLKTLQEMGQTADEEASSMMRRSPVRTLSRHARASRPFWIGSRATACVPSSSRMPAGLRAS